MDYPQLPISLLPNVFCVLVSELFIHWVSKYSSYTTFLTMYFTEYVGFAGGG